STFPRRPRPGVSGLGVGNQPSPCAGPNRVVRVEVRLLDATVLEVVGDAFSSRPRHFEAPERHRRSLTETSGFRTCVPWYTRSRRRAETRRKQTHAISTDTAH